MSWPLGRHNTFARRTRNAADLSIAHDQFRNNLQNNCPGHVAVPLLMQARGTCSVPALVCMVSKPSTFVVLPFSVVWESAGLSSAMMSFYEKWKLRLAVLGSMRAARFLPGISFKNSGSHFGNRVVNLSHDFA